MISKNVLRPSIFALLAIIFIFGLWAGGPRVADEDKWTYCTYNIELNEHIGQSISCDFVTFIWPARFPELLFDTDSPRQSRPGTIILAHVISTFLVFPLSPFFSGYESIEFPDGTNLPDDSPFVLKRSEFMASYLGYVIQNLIIILLCCLLYFKAIGFKHLNREMFLYSSVLFALVLIVNNQTKIFLWSPHTQIFSLLAAMTAIHFFQSIQKSSQPQKMFYALSLLCGIGMLFYGVFVLTIIIIGLGYLWTERRHIYPFGKSGLPIFANSLFAVFLFIIPYAIWYAFIRLLTGGFDMYDVETYGGFKWLPETASREGWGETLKILFHHFMMMWAGACTQGAVFIALLASLAFFAWYKHITPPPLSLWIGGGLYALFTATFFSFYGLSVARLSFPMVIPLFPLIGFYLRTIEQSLTRPVILYCITLAGISLYVAFMLIKFGPYS